MTTRGWAWAGGCGVAGVLVLALTVHSVATFSPPAHSAQVLTLGQVVGFLFSGLLIIVSALITISGLRRRRELRRQERHRQQRADPAR
jgi:hypothetical protein